MLLLRLSICLTLLLLGHSVAAAADYTRFWTTAGPEPMGHDIDPDFGNQREFFRMDDQNWVERFPDGFLIIFKVVGAQQLLLSIVSSSQQPGTASGVVIASTTSNLQYFILDRIQPGSRLAYRSGNAGSFFTGSPINLFTADDTASRLYVQVAGSIAKIREALFASVPSTIDERGDPNADAYRYRFDALTDPDHRKMTVANGRIYLQQVFTGDWETTCTFCLGCHLKPLHVLAQVDFVPAIIQADDQWVISATQPNASLSLMDGSDTSCTFADVPVRDRVENALGRASLRDRSVEAIRRAEVKIPVNTIWANIQGPFARSFNNQRVCLYPRPQAAWAGNLRADDVALIGEVVIMASPKALFSSTCPAAPAKPFQTFDGSRPGPGGRVTLDVTIPFSEVRNTILRGDSVREAGIDDLSIEPHQAYMTLKLRQRDGNTLSVNAIPIIPIPEQEGDVSLTLIFADVPGAPSGSSLSALNGSYTVSLADKVAALKSALQGSFEAGNLKLVIPQVGLDGVTLVCESDGLHAYVNINAPVFANWAL
jgi:hypothetical protein